VKKNDRVRALGFVFQLVILIAAYLPAEENAMIPCNLENLVSETRETVFCPMCEATLTYRRYYFGHLGDYWCPNCNFGRPSRELTVVGVDSVNPLGFYVQQRKTAPLPASGCSEPVAYTAPLRGFYNLYNILAAIATARILRIKSPTIQTALLSLKPVAGRMQEFEWGRRLLILTLIKNPAGVNEVLKTIFESKETKAFIIALNDLAADGRDVSWIWDASFNLLADPSVKLVICSGRRAADLAVCLKYRGVDPARLKIIQGAQQSLNSLYAQNAAELHVLVTYTNLSSYNRILRSRKGMTTRCT
jgi:UDP-N-acetylmuramyl tripeptide synthase